jgi:DNA mismatch endonuclease (patch repair protein)
MDIVSKEKRASMMAAVRQKNTRPEILLRQALHRSGLRFRLHRRDLPGTPDIVFPARRAVIFVHGCFWHRHAGCRRATLPATKTEFWIDKFSKNVERDLKAQTALKKMGWKVIIVWECQLLTSEGARSLAKSFSRILRKKSSSSGRLPVANNFMLPILDQFPEFCDRRCSFLPYRCECFFGSVLNTVVNHYKRCGSRRGQSSVGTVKQLIVSKLALLNVTERTQIKRDFVQASAEVRFYRHGLSSK